MTGRARLPVRAGNDGENKPAMTVFVMPDVIGHLAPHLIVMPDLIGHPKKVLRRI